MNNFVKGALVIAALGSTFVLTGCDTDAKIASHNLSKAAEQFEIARRIVFYNGITGEYMLVMEGRCSLEDQNKQLEVTCKVGKGEYKKHFLGLSHNVTYFAEQVRTANVSVNHYKVIFKPQSILPDIDLETSLDD